MPRPTRIERLARRIGARIRALRGEAQITQERLAWDCDLAKPYMSQIEAGKRLPSVAVLDAIAKRLSVEMADLLSTEMTDPRSRLFEAARQKDRPAVHHALKALGLD